jgi:hypothetical protein
MSITVLTNAQQPIPAANKAIYTVSGSNRTQPNYRYVADIERVGGGRLARLKCDKLPTTSNGFFNVADVAKSLIVPAKPNPIAGWMDAAIAERFVIKFREEYGTTPAVSSGSTDVNATIWKAYFPQQAIPVTSGYAAASGMLSVLALTNRPQSITLKTGQSDWLAMQKTTTSGTLNAEIVYPTRSFQVASASGFLSGLFNFGAVQSLTSGQTSDSLPGAVNFPKTREQAWEYYQARADAAGAFPSENTACAKALYDQLVPENPFGVGFEVSLLAVIGDSDTFTQTYSVTIDDCERYPSQVVYFRNALGGVDAYDFKMKNRTRFDAERSTYNRNSDVFGTTSYDEVWQTQYTEQLDLNSDWLTDAEFVWLKEMFLTSQCWVLQDGELIEAVIVPTSYRVETRQVDRLRQLNMQIRIAYKNTTL